MLTESRGHRFCIGSLDAEGFSFLHKFAGDLRYAPVNPRDIREIHEILWDGVVRMMAHRKNQIKEAYRKRKLRRQLPTPESAIALISEVRSLHDYETYDGGGLEMAQDH